MPLVIGGEEIVRRNEDRIVPLLGRPEEALDVVNGAIVLDARLDSVPVGASLAENIILGIDQDQCRIRPVKRASAAGLQLSCGHCSVLEGEVS